MPTSNAQHQNDQQGEVKQSKRQQVTATIAADAFGATHRLFVILQTVKLNATDGKRAVRLESTAKRYGIAKYKAQTSNNLKGLQ